MHKIAQLVFIHTIGCVAIDDNYIFGGDIEEILPSVFVGDATTGDDLISGVVWKQFSSGDEAMQFSSVRFIEREMLIISVGISNSKPSGGFSHVGGILYASLVVLSQIRAGLHAVTVRHVNMSRQLDAPLFVISRCPMLPPLREFLNCHDPTGPCIGYRPGKMKVLREWEGGVVWRVSLLLSVAMSTDGEVGFGGVADEEHRTAGGGFGRRVCRGVRAGGRWC